MAGSDEWQTPPDFLDMVRHVFGNVIELDPASNRTAQQAVQAQEYYSIEEGRDGLSLPWGAKKVFCNPPYSARNVDAFAYKAVKEFNNGADVIMLVNSSTDTQWYHHLLNASAVTLLWRGRLKFWKIYNDQAHATWSLNAEDGKVGNSPRYLNTVFYLGRNAEGFLKAFQGKGTFLTRI